MYFLANTSVKISEYQNLKPFDGIGNGKDLVYPWETEVYCFNRLQHLFVFFVLPLSILAYMTKSRGGTGIYRCSVFGIWVKGHHAG